MKDWYFPQSVHEEAHKNYIAETGCTPDELREYCLKHIDFFFDITFAYVERLPKPEMQK